MSLYNLVKVTTATLGTGTIALGNASSGYLSFVTGGVSDGTISYGIQDGVNSEVGRGTFVSSASTLSRDTILKSTNSNNPIALSGTANVFITALAEDFTALTPVNGWITESASFVYASADDPTYTFTVSGSKMSTYYPGVRVQLTQTTPKYFLVTSSSYVAPNTAVTVYGGSDYDLENAAITVPSYSTVKAPFGFPLDPTKWTQEVSSVDGTQLDSPVVNTWYNAGSVVINIPIGIWNVSYQCCPEKYNESVDSIQMETTLSTANNSVSDDDFSTHSQVNANSGYVQDLIAAVGKFKILNILSKTSYYLILRTTYGATGTRFIRLRGDLSKTIIRAVSSYL